jgi:carbon-monoxide dehydrogenase large subunit
MKVSNSYIGRPMERVEDLRMLRGRGTYVGDVNRPDQLYAVILRSSVAHGYVRSIDVSRALDLPGIKSVVTAADLGTAVPRIPMRLHPLPQFEQFYQPVLADGKVRYVGEPIAVVVAESPALAEDALEHIDLDIEPLPAVTDRAQSHDTNTTLSWKASLGDADAAFKAADYVRRQYFKVQRHAAMFMEPRGLVAEWDKDRGKLTVWGAAKMAWYNRRVLAGALGLPEDAIDLIEVDVGGAFGSRGEFYPEDYLISAAAKMLGRPVKWIEDRREHLTSSNHARDVECDIQIALSRDGRFLGLRGEIWVDVGAYLRTNASIAPRNVAQFMCGPYGFEGIDLTSTMITTNKTPCGSYRGPGRFETDFFRERLIDIAASELGIDRVELRRRNLVADDQMPYRLPTIEPHSAGNELDSGDYRAVFDRCLAEFNWAEKSKLRGRLIDGRYHGLSVGSFIEGGAVGPKEDSRLVLETDGSLSVYLGSSAIGQGLETIMAQIAADAMELPYEKITVHHGSTSHVKEGYGSYHSRSTVMGGSSILVAAEKLKERIREIAAKRFNCAVSDIVVDGEEVRYAGNRLPFSSLSDVPIEIEASFYNNKQTWAYGTQAAHVAIDPGTGHVQVIDYVSVEDVGRMINPLTLHGQAIGSIVQGLGGTLLEHIIYDEEGQLLTGSLADYLMPTATDFPNIRSIVLELKPCPNNPLGAKGAGEGGIIPVGGIISNAVADALSHLNVQPVELPLSPPRVWQMIEDAQHRISEAPPRR